MNIRDCLISAMDSSSAVVAINAPSFDAMVGIAKASAESGLPAIIQVSARIIKQHGAPAVYAWYQAATSIHSGQCFLHLDHCHDDDILRACITAGWDMVMFDGSGLPIGENCARSREISDFAHAHGCAVEGEVGQIGGEEDGHEATANYAPDADIEALSKDGGLDCIAVGFGNVHGDYATKSNLRWDIFEGARALTDLPLVLHGGSGLSDAEFLRAIRAGAAKINISTELKKAYVRALADPELQSRIASDPSALHTRLSEESRRIALSYMALFSSISKDPSS